MTAKVSMLAACLGLVLSLFGSGSVVAQGSPTIPPGFRSSVFASGFYQPTALAVGPDKRLYVAQRDGLIRRVDKQGLTTVASGFSTPLGLAWHGGKLYVSSTGIISTLTPSHRYARFTRKEVVSGIPTGLHQNDSLAFRRGWMYTGVGSTCNACRESDARSATIMRFHYNGTHAQIFARGLRNPFGLAFRPSTGRLYATDNGRDDFGDSVPDELNKIVRGGRYGWPSCWGDRGGTHCKGTIRPVALFGPHPSADGLLFYSRHKFPQRYRGDAFVAEWGDTVDNLGTGHVVDLVHFASSGAKVKSFASGLENPIALAISPNGSLLVADYGSGIVWRIQAS